MGGNKSAWVRSYLQASKFSAFPRRERATVGSKAARWTSKLPRDRGYGNCKRYGVGVAAGCAASSEAEMYGYNTLAIEQVSALGSAEASALQRFICISIMGDSNGGSATVRSRGGVLSREGPFSEVPLYLCTKFHTCIYLLGFVRYWILCIVRFVVVYT